MARDDALAEVRRERIIQIIDTRFNGNNTAFAIAIGRSPSQVGHWRSRVRKPNGDTCRDIEEKLQLPRDFIDGVEGDIPDEDDPGTSRVDHQLSQLLPIVTPRTIVWEDLPVESFESPFGLEIKDDALLPRYAAGLMGCFVPGVQPEQGDAVMIETPDKRWELRFYQPGVAPGQWAGVSPTPGYGPLDSASGCRVVAVMAWATRKSLYTAMR